MTLTRPFISAPNHSPTGVVWAALTWAFLLILTTVITAHAVHAETSEPYVSPAVTARLITVQDGVPPGTTLLTAGLHLEMGDGWKTYWRSPGEVGLPPEIDWTGSSNLAAVDFQYPAPHRFSAFGIENFGYEREVVFPLQIRLAQPDTSTSLRASVNILVCADICIPAVFDLSLDLTQSAQIDQSSASLIADFARQVPDDGTSSGLSITAAHLDADLTTLTLTAQSETPLINPDIFTELGDYTAFGKPDIRLSDEGRSLWAEIPILSSSPPLNDLAVTLTDGPRAATLSPALSDIAPPPPYATDRASNRPVLWMLFLAFLGGVILNAMPCVLPVLSIKLTTAVKYRDHSMARIRNGFLMSTVGVLAFMWGLAAVLILLRQAGVTVGWGLQFQSPVFLTFVILLLTLFAANLFGLFEITLPSFLNTRMAQADGAAGYGGDFATGAFAALLATPCSAPILGTAVAFALSGSSLDIVLVFTALGLGLAVPYLLVALKPSVICYLPKPGPWMIWLKGVLGLMLAATVIWMLAVLYGASGLPLTGMVTLGVVALALVLWVGRRSGRTNRLAGACAILATAALPFIITPALGPASTPTAHWLAFDRSEIAQRVATGQIVFVDVTADWCLTCKANKALVLDRDPVISLLRGDGIVAMQADWTRPDPAISRYLEGYGRYGIPFNIVYGPNAPDGIPLPELLTTQSVTDALAQAAGN